MTTAIRLSHTGDLDRLAVVGTAEKFFSGGFWQVSVKVVSGSGFERRDCPDCFKDEWEADMLVDDLNNPEGEI